MLAAACSECGAAASDLVTTYKHTWRTCRSCGVTTRARRERYPLQRVLPERLVRRVVPAVAADMFYPMAAVREEDRHFYDYYAEVSADGAAGTKWAEQIEHVTGRLDALGVALDGAVLDVSGGPGFMAQHLAGRARRVVVTELSADAAAGMARNLGIDARAFDYNADHLEAVVDGPFDVVLVDASVNFCLDLGAFARSLAVVVAPGGHVYLSFSLPTLGLFLRWQFDEYTYNRLWPAAVVDEALASAGFVVVDEFEDARFGWLARFPLRVNAVRAPWLVWSRLRARRRGVAYDATTDQIVLGRVYRFDPPS